MSIAENIASIKQIIKDSNREINLIVVSKNVDEEKIKQAIECGCDIFGENKVIEAKAKWPELKALYPNVKLHLIGHLQSNKAKDAVQIFDVIETLDSEKLAQDLKKEMQKQDKFPEIFVQINIGEEEQKSGIKPIDAKDFIQKTINDYKLPITGVMAIPPLDCDPTMYFALLLKIARDNNLQNVSMGMSNDFKIAINMGANFIRIGTAIFGERT